MVTSEERLRELEEKYEDYKVYDNQGDKIGKVDDLFVDEADQEEYIGVKLGLLGGKSTLIPMEIVRVNEADKAIEVSDTKDHVEDAPSFDDDEEVTAEYEQRIREHFGLESGESSSSRGSYGGYSEGDGATTGTSAAAGERQDESSQDYSSRGSEESTGLDESLVGTQSSEGSSRGAPTSRQTEETETYQEGGRTKVRRRIVREEIIDADEDPNAVP